MVVTVASGCAGATDDPGLTAYLRLSGAQFVAGALEPAAPVTTTAVVDGGARTPVVNGINLQTSTVSPGLQSLPLSGDVENGTSVLVGLAGDSGHWILPAPTADFLQSDNFIFQSKLSFSPLTPTGQHALLFRGVSPDGSIGPSLQVNLNVTAPVPTGALVISLAWDTNADLDLHVVAPNPSDPSTPIEIWSKAPVGLPPRVPGAPPLVGPELTAAVAAAGKLDFDSNANCVIDGHRQENVVFTEGPPAGDYVVRVDAFSMCGQVDAQWQVTAALGDGTPAGFARWEATDTDTRGTHGAGSGRTAFTFHI
ncbi:MAG TPA: hypothetical protein VHO67_23350, partial [Polyangia bacterium]|nr:hypothetical protein [Polyangia bacterium]